MSRLTIEIPDEMHKRIKALAALNGQNIKEFVLGQLQVKAAPTKTGKEKKPSRQLQRALKEARDPSKLLSFKDTESLFRYLRE